MFVGDGYEKARGRARRVRRRPTVYTVDADGLDDYLVLPKAEALAAVVEAAGGAVGAGRGADPGVREGKEVAARLAVKLDSGLITDAVDVQAGDGPAGR